MVVTRGHGSHPGPSAGDERHAPNPNNAYAYTNTHTNTRIESYSSPAPTLPGRTPFSAQPSPAWAPTNKKPVGSSYFVVIDGNEAAISYSQADGRSSALGPLLAIQVGECTAAVARHVWACPRLSRCPASTMFSMPYSTFSVVVLSTDDE